VALKSGRTQVGARAAASHTGALVAASEVSIDALFRHAGVLRAATVAEFLDLATLLERQPLPAGDHVAIVTNAGGPGVLCADACVAAGLAVPRPPDATADRLRRDLPAAAAVGNPVDMLATADPETFAHTVSTVLAEGWAHALIVIFVKVGDEPGAVFEAAVRRAAARVPDAPPVLWVDLSSAPGATASSPLPAYTFPEEAAGALGRAAAYARWRRRPPDPPPELGARRGDAAALLAARAGDTPAWLAPEDVGALCRAYGIPLVHSRTARTTPAVVAAARAVGFPVALKAIAPGLTHKTEAGGVRVGLTSEAEVAAAVKTMRHDVRRAGHHVEAFLVQPVLEPAVELLVGITNDPQLGPLVVCGAGGVRAEVERDLAVRLAPVGRLEAREALRTLRAHRVLEGWRGAPRCDIEAVEDLVVRTGVLAAAHPEIVELDFNPVAASPGGAVVLDARVRVVRAAPAAPWPAVGTSPPPALD
ncbi:MAG TPA: acetate--CoA ligase family protein, partial [Baekduia sp.]|nr:acetate--CoA ligase family protein [Baekduia sp.]